MKNALTQPQAASIPLVCCPGRYVDRLQEAWDLNLPEWLNVNTCKVQVEILLLYLQPCPQGKWLFPTTEDKTIIKWGRRPSSGEEQRFYPCPYLYTLECAEGNQSQKALSLENSFLKWPLY